MLRQLLLNTYLNTLRCKVQNSHPWEISGPWILGIWHQDLPMALRQFRGLDMMLMVSSSKDGELASRYALKNGYQVVRGSSSGYQHVLRHLARHLDQGLPVGMAWDGPRGPAGSIFPGTLWLQEKYRVPVLIPEFEYQNPWRINSWDRTIFPKPFSLTKVNYRIWDSSKKISREWIKGS